MRVWRDGSAWSVSVDGLGSRELFPTESAAWEAGVRIADALDGDGATGASAPGGKGTPR